MEIKLKPVRPTYKRRLKSGTNPWCIAAIVGLLGTWFSGTRIDIEGAGIMDHQVTVAVTPATGIITFVWGVIVFWWYKQVTARTKAYRLASRGKQDYLMIDDFGITWGVVDVAHTKIAWAAVAFYRLDKSKNLELGLPAESVEVSVDELEGAEADEIEALLQSKGVKKTSW